MRDFNFFSPYIEVKRDFKNKSLSAVASAFVLAAVIGSIYYHYHSKIINLEKELDSMEAYLHSKKVAQSLEQVKDMRKKLELANQYYDAVKKIHDDINSMNVINSSLVEDIALKVPSDIFIENMSITTDGLMIEGISKTRTSVAEFEHHLYDLDRVGRVYVSVIQVESEESDNYSFNLQCTFR